MYQIEVTDTYADEANYCWVKRGTTRAKTRRGQIAAAKRIAGWTGYFRVKVEAFGDAMCIRPVSTARVCQIAFVTWID